MVIINHTIANNDRTVTGRYFGTGNGSRLAFNLAGMDSDRALLMPVLYQQDWAGVQQLYGTSRTNLLIRSNTFNTGWTLASATVNANVVGPDGVTNSAWTVTDTSAAVTGDITQSLNLTAAAYTYSIYVKKTIGAQASYPLLYVLTGSNIGLVTIDTSNGVATPWTAYTGLTIIPCTSTCTSVGGFWLVTMTFTGTATAFIISIDPSATAVSNQSTGTANVTLTGSAVVFKAQLELGSVATSRIDTAATAVAVTDYTVAATGVVTYASAPAAGTVLSYKEPHLPSSNVFRTFGVGNGTTTQYSLPWAPATPTIYANGVQVVGGTNLLLQSQTLGTSPWLVSGADVEVSVDAGTAPDSTSTADKIRAKTVTSNIRYMKQEYSTSAIQYTFSAYLKKVENNYGLLQVFDGASNYRRSFNLNTGALGAVSGGPVTNATITDAGSGWYRCTITMTTAASATTSFRVWEASTDSEASTTDTIGNGILAWGVQLNTGATADAYVATTTTSQSSTGTTVAPDGTCTFGTAPANNAVLTWTGNMGKAR